MLQLIWHDYFLGVFDTHEAAKANELNAIDGLVLLGLIKLDKYCL